MSDNPWVVDNLKDFWFMNCPECIYKTKTENSFQDHAFENHPLSFVLFETYAKTNPGSENNNCDDSPEIDSVEQDETNNFVVKFKEEEDKVEKILKGSLDSISSPLPSVKIQNMGGKVCLRCKGKTLLGIVNKLFIFKSLLTTPSNVLPLHLKQTFPPIICIFTEGEGDGIESRLSFKIFSTLERSALLFNLLKR